MFRNPLAKFCIPVRNFFTLVTIGMGLWIGGFAYTALAQDPSSQKPNPNQQQAPPEAGGPGDEVGPYAIPKKKDEPPPPPVEKPKNVEGMPDYSIRVDVPLVNLDVTVVTKNG